MVTIRRCMPGDRVTGLAAPSNCKVDGFWSWAYGDLCDDDVKGAFSEWLVAHLLGLSHPRRVAGAKSDLIASGVRIEVKSASYWQSWRYTNEDGSTRELPSTELRREPAPGKVRFGKIKPHSDLYVFCLRHESDLTRWNALDLSQWEFYALTRKELAFPQGREEISMTLATLRAGRHPLSAAELSCSGPAILRQLNGGPRE